MNEQRNDKSGPAWNGKWCTYCRTDSHTDAECWSTRPADWHPGRFVPCDTGWLRTTPSAERLMLDADHILENAAIEVEGTFGRAHTLASENSDRYIAQDEAIRLAAKRIRAMKGRYAASHEPLSWQPIETAPKTGPVETILLYVPTLHGTGGPVLAHWAHGGGEEQPAFGPAWFFWTGYDFSELTERPTHWMALPRCPADWRGRAASAREESGNG